MTQALTKKHEGPLTRDEVRDQSFALVGILPEELGAEVIGRVRALLGASKTRFFAHEGKVTDSRDIEDNAARLGAARLGAELAGVLTSVGVGQRLGPAVVNIMLPDWGTAPGSAPVSVTVTEAAPVPDPSVVNAEVIDVGVKVGG